MAQPETPEQPPANLPARQRHRSGNTPGKRVSTNGQDLADRRLKALELRIAGKTYDQIAKELGVGYKAAWDYVHHTLRVREEELVPQLRQIEADRLDRVLQVAFGIADNSRTKVENKLKALDRVIRAVQVRANLFGLNAPVEVTLREHSQQSPEIEALIKRAEQTNQAIRAQIIEGEVVEDGGPGAVA